jgi:predicted AAA+ superfamily ATPase
MKRIPKNQVIKRIQTENPWWKPPFTISEEDLSFRRRAYFKLFMPLVVETSVKRAILLMGPRRVGKTVLIHQAIQEIINANYDPRRLCYLSIDHPLYNGCGLQELLEHYGEATKLDISNEQAFVFFDEIQYLKDWEVHLKVLVDDYPNIKFIASGSAAAALRLKSNESGAGRFTDFLLPPLTFHEYLDLLGKLDLIKLDISEEAIQKGGYYEPVDINDLNQAFLHYLNFGGYPEVIFSEVIQADPARFVKNDIIDRVLLRDLPGLYGIQDIQELNHLFTTLAFNTANEVSLEQLSQNSGVAKNTIKRYIEYLEAAFLIRTVHRIDHNAKRFQRATFFKVYLTNPSIWSALFSPINESDDSMGGLAETAIFSQWFHSYNELHYARWNKGEIDIVKLGNKQKPVWAVEVKWTNRYLRHIDELKSVISFCHSHGLKRLAITSRTEYDIRRIGDLEIVFVPTSVYCFTVGYNIVRSPRTAQRFLPVPATV